MIMATTLRKAPKGNADRKLLATQFSEHFGAVGFEDAPDGYEISLEHFDLWIIDQKFAQDPECCPVTDPESIQWKGFVQQRNQAKNLLNRCAKLLPEHFSYVIKPGASGDDKYYIVPWQTDAKREAKDVRARVATFTKNKVDSIDSLRLIAEKKVGRGEDAETLMGYLNVTAAARQRLLAAQDDIFENFELICSEAERAIKKILLEGGK
jgi:hypothetical protein